MCEKVLLKYNGSLIKVFQKFQKNSPKKTFVENDVDNDPGKDERNIEKWRRLNVENKKI